MLGPRPRAIAGPKAKSPAIAGPLRDGAVSGAFRHHDKRHSRFIKSGSTRCCARYQMTSKLDSSYGASHPAIQGFPSLQSNSALQTTFDLQANAANLDVNFSLETVSIYAAFWQLSGPWSRPP